MEWWRKAEHPVNKENLDSNLQSPGGKVRALISMWGSQSGKKEGNAEVSRTPQKGPASELNESNSKRAWPPRKTAHLQVRTSSGSPSQKRKESIAGDAIIEEFLSKTSRRGEFEGLTVFSSVGANRRGSELADMIAAADGPKHSEAVAAYSILAGPNTFLRPGKRNNSGEIINTICPERDSDMKASMTEPVQEQCVSRKTRSATAAGAAATSTTCAAASGVKPTKAKAESLAVHEERLRVIEEKIRANENQLRAGETIVQPKDEHNVETRVPGNMHNTADERVQKGGAHVRSDELIRVDEHSHSRERIQSDEVKIPAQETYSRSHNSQESRHRSASSNHVFYDIESARGSVPTTGSMLGETGIGLVEIGAALRVKTPDHEHHEHHGRSSLVPLSVQKSGIALPGLTEGSARKGAEGSTRKGAEISGKGAETLRRDSVVILDQPQVQTPVIIRSSLPHTPVIEKLLMKSCEKITQAVVQMSCNVTPVVAGRRSCAEGRLILRPIGEKRAADNYELTDKDSDGETVHVPLDQVALEAQMASLKDNVSGQKGIVPGLKGKALGAAMGVFGASASPPSRPVKHVPAWVENWQLTASKQQQIDPESVFGSSIPKCDLSAILTERNYASVVSKRVKSPKPRGSSANWRCDELSQAEIDDYRLRCGQTMKAEGIFHQPTPKR